MNISDDDIDNILADITAPDSVPSVPSVAAAAETDDELTTEYLAKFDPVEGSQMVLSNLIKSLPKQVNQDQRLAVVLEYIQEQQRLNERTFELLVSMNNMFAPTEKQ